jgi:hypothetical protein
MLPNIENGRIILLLMFCLEDMTWGPNLISYILTWNIKEQYVIFLVRDIEIKNIQFNVSNFY